MAKYKVHTKRYTCNNKVGTSKNISFYFGASQLLLPSNEPRKHIPSQHKVVSTSLKHYWYMQQVDTVFPMA